MSNQITRTLSNGKTIPAVGLGTWLSEKNEVKKACKHALAKGYRHIDAAWIYGNEEEIGEALEETWSDSLKRSDVWITSKLWNTKHHPDDVRPALEDTLKKLRTDYVDLYLIHWPTDLARGDDPFPKDPNDENENAAADPPISLEDTWKAMEALVDAGLAKSIGISNFSTSQVQQILDCARIPPVAIQIESHPYLQQDEMFDFCKKHNIAVTAYSPLANSNPSRPGASKDDPVALKDEELIAIGKQYNKSPAQVMIRWQLERGAIVIPKSVNEERIEQNLDVFDFTLSSSDMERIAKLNKNWRAIDYPAHKHPKYPF